MPSLSWSPFDFGSTATEMTGSGNVIDSSTIGAFSARERVARRRALEPDAGGDLAGHDRLALLAVVRVHLEDAADPLGLAGDRVEDAVAGLERAGVDAEVRELADERVGHDLEGERRERRVRIGRALVLGLGLRVEAVHRRHVERARQVVDHGVEQQLDALVLEGRAEQDRRDLVGERAGADGAADHLRRHRGLVLDVRPEHLVVEVRDRVDQLVVVLLRPARRARPGSRRRRTPCRGRPCRRRPASRRGRRRP